MTTRRTLALITLLGAGALVFAGCATASPAPASSGAGSAPAGTELEVEAGWLDGGRMVALVTQGSSTCIPSATEATLQADGTVAITLEDPAGDTPCTADLAPRASLVALPDGVDVTQDVDFVITYNDARGETDLDAYSGGAVEEYSPSAGWIDDGLFAIVTWGSSSCAPAIQDVTADGSAVTVGFIDPPADQVCTMDMAPRVALASVTGVSDEGATVTLTGGGAEFATPVTVPIAA